MLDQQRADMTPMEDRHPYVRMPCIEGLAQKGTYFGNSYTPSPICVPARQAILAGQYPQHCGCRDWGQDIAPDVMTYPQWFGNHGYYTAAAGKMHLQGPDQMKGWQRRIGFEQVVPASAYRGFDAAAWREQELRTPGTGKWLVWDDEVRNARYGEGYWNRHDRYAVDGALLFLDQYFADVDYDRVTERPLLLQVSLTMPHFPYICREEWFSYYLHRVEPFVEDPADDHPCHSQRRVQAGRDVTPRQLQRAWAAYCGMISEADAQFARVIDRLQHLGVCDDFIVVFHADHGDMMGEHGVWEKFVFFEGAVRVPLMISAPGMGWPPRVVRQNVNLLDLYPTLCDLAGIAQPQELDGRSLVPLMRGEAVEDPDAETLSELYCYSDLDECRRHRWGRGQQLMIKRAKYKYVTYEMADWPDQLFDLDTDPRERHNLAGKPEYARLRRAFATRAEEFHAAARRPPFPVGTGRWVYAPT
jgi:choline-sulfatase